MLHIIIVGVSVYIGTVRTPLFDFGVVMKYQ